ncbi:enoyl-CoA hydratase-related protein [Rhizorhabdus wittichii]|uniref:enoyl-CoA hydratase-related protein n=1 Tax=Rhizorhabdus wittichii TaxID=160791 RepID=UPI00030FFBA9|nr:enoyl-CoA hydratase-related protein [Rhizorhabdus wittichii]
MAAFKYILVDEPAAGVCRITLNRPEKRNALSNMLRGEMFAALEAADRDPDVRVMILRGAGVNFSAGYDLSSDLSVDHPFHTAGGFGQWPRHVTEGCMRMWDLAKPVIAQVHGYCLAGGSELAVACDLLYVSEDARIGHPVVRAISPPDNQFYPWLIGMRRSMEMMLTGDSLTGREAEAFGLANRCVPLDELEQLVLDVAARIAMVPADIQQINKRAVHRQMEVMGIRTGIRAGTETQMLGALTPSAQEHLASVATNLNQALSDRDRRFGDNRERHG